MAIDKITTAQFRAELSSAITNRTKKHDVAYGAIREVVIDPTATVLERQNDRIRRVSLLVSLINSDEYTDDELEALVYNEGLTRIAGAQATATVTFATLSIDTSGPDLIVPRGFPIGTQPDQSSGEAVTFITTESATLDVSAASSYLNQDTDPPQYELDVPVVCTVAGTQGIVGATRINRLLRPLTGFDTCSNAAASTGGRDRETNAELIERYLLAVLGRDITTPAGIERYIRDNFAAATDVLVAHGTDAILTRGTDDAGACDVYVLGAESITRTDDVEYLGLNQLLEVSYPPVISITSVANITTPATYTEGTDYEVVTDDAVGGSPRASEGVEFITGGSAPALGDIVRITYESNNLIRRIQDELDSDDVTAIGRDALARAATEVPIILEASLRVATGFDSDDIEALVVTALDDAINNLELGDDVEVSDLQLAVRRISGVDNFIVTRLVRDSDDTAADDVTIEKSEYATLDTTTDLTITQI